jgi:NAD(P)-dependent dehydrogenase (short-subunit alcohol dehydrogenase family)
MFPSPVQPTCAGLNFNGTLAYYILAYKQVSRFLCRRRASDALARDPDEFGPACAFLCSAHAGYITGPNILIDGGAYPGTF